MPLEHSLLAPIQELERAYQFFNEKLFDNALNEKVIITIQTRGRRQNALAWYWQNRWNTQDGNTSDKGEIIAELNFSAETIRDFDAYESLIHEMVHHKCAIQGIQDCSRNGKYHNKRFKEAAEAAGLICEKDARIGWAFTKLGVLGTRVKAELCPKPEVFRYLRFAEGSGKAKKKKMRKWSCQCGICFWAEASYEIEARCLNCESDFVCC